jgi:hypothetical protein
MHSIGVLRLGCLAISVPYGAIGIETFMN